MAKPLQIQILERARSLIAEERHWCRGQLAEDASGVSVFPTASSAVKRCGLANELAHNALRPLWARG